MSSEFEKYKKDIIRTAKDLRYGDDVIVRLKESSSEAECTRIMASARKGRRN